MALPTANTIHFDDIAPKKTRGWWNLKLKWACRIWRILFTWGDFKKSIWKKISQIFPRKKKKKNTNKSSFGSNKTCFLPRFCWGFWTKKHPFGDLQLLTKTAGLGMEILKRYSSTLFRRYLNEGLSILGNISTFLASLKFASDFTLFQSQDFRVSDEVWVSMENLRWISFGCSAFPYFCGQMQWNIATNKWHQNQQLDHLYSWGTNVTSYMTSPSNHQM